jgi:hypothetical protein
LEDVFLSYCSQDRERDNLLRLVAALEQSGLSVFWDRLIPPGMTWRTVLQQRLTQARTVVVVWTKDSISSEWCHEEADHGRTRDILFPVLLDKVTQPIGFGGVQAADLSDWDGNPSDPALQALLAAVHARACALREATHAHTFAPPVLMSSPSLTAHTHSVEPRSSRGATTTKMAVIAGAFGLLGVATTTLAFLLRSSPAGPTQAAIARPAAPPAPVPSATANAVLDPKRAGRLFFEDFSRREAVRTDFWLLGTRGPWSGEVTSDAYELCNRSGSERAHVRTFGVFDDRKLGADPPAVTITMSVKLTGKPSEHAAAGIFFRATPERAYAFARGPGRSVVLLEGEPGKMKLVRSLNKGPAESEFVTLRVDANGKQARLSAGNEGFDSVSSNPLGSERIGIFARGGECFVVDELSVSSPARGF